MKKSRNDESTVNKQDFNQRQLQESVSGDHIEIEYEQRTSGYILNAIVAEIQAVYSIQNFVTTLEHSP
ncbi:unnamed protein product, partial [Rotaria magnacalcarata]